MSESDVEKNFHEFREALIDILKDIVGNLKDNRDLHKTIAKAIHMNTARSLALEEAMLEAGISNREYLSKRTDEIFKALVGSEGSGDE